MSNKKDFFRVATAHIGRQMKRAARTGMGILVNSFPMQLLRMLQRLRLMLGFGGIVVLRCTSLRTGIMCLSGAAEAPVSAPLFPGATPGGDSGCADARLRGSGVHCHIVSKVM